MCVGFGEVPELGGALCDCVMFSLVAKAIELGQLVKLGRSLGWEETTVVSTTAACARPRRGRKLGLVCGVADQRTRFVLHASRGTPRTTVAFPIQSHDCKNF